MQEVKIKSEINYDYDKRFSNFLLNRFIELLIKFFIDLKYILFIFAFFFFISISLFNRFYRQTFLDLTPLIQFVADCKNSINYNRDKIYNTHPYISVCIPAYNMEEYIERNLLSIINQSFQDFEIIIVNDASEDNTKNIISKIQSNDKRIKLLSHSKKLGVYRSRMESIINSRSKYVLLMDPDDMYLNENLFKELYNYNIQNNLDIIEFSVLQQNEGCNEIYYPKIQFGNHYHNFDKIIIYQPELSDILYHLPGKKEYSRTICRNIWNKIIRNEIFIKAKDYIGKEYYNEYIIVADDLLLNVITYQFANNFSNIFLPGYLYLKRNVSMSRGGNHKIKEIRAINFLFYFKIFFKYIKDFKKDINILFPEMKNLEKKIITNEKNNTNKYIGLVSSLFQQILHEKNISIEFEEYIQNLSTYFKN